MLLLSCQDRQKVENKNTTDRISRPVVFDTIYCANKDKSCHDYISKRSNGETKLVLKSGNDYSDRIWIFELLYLDESGFNTFGLFKSESWYYSFIISKDLFNYSLVSQRFKPRIKKIDLRDICLYEIHSILEEGDKRFFAFNNWVFNKKTGEFKKIQYVSDSNASSIKITSKEDSISIGYGYLNKKYSYTMFLKKGTDQLEVLKTTLTGTITK